MLKKLIFGLLLLVSLAAQAAVYSLPWGPKPQFVDANGAPMSSGTLSFYAAGTTTPQNTYTDSTGGVANSNPITLNTRGETPNEVWFTGGASYKMILKDSSGSTVWSVDNISGVNDVTNQLGLEWLSSGLTPTFVSATSFTVTGDQTLTLHVGRRLKTVNSGGTIYSTVTASVFGSVTTVTVANDSGALDAGLSNVAYGLISANNPSISPQMIHRKATAVASATTTDIWSIAGDYVHITGTTTITSLGTAPYAGAQRTVIFDGALTLTNGTSLVLPGGGNITTATNDRMVVRADTTTNMIVVDYVKATGASVIGGIPRGAIDGLTLATSGSSDLMSVSPGQAADSTGAVLMNLGSLFNKHATSWTVGSEGGCLDTGAVAASAWYHFFLINRPDTNVTDVLCSTSASSPTMPTNYTIKRRIGSGLTDGSAHWTAFSQLGDEFLWNASVLDVSAANPGTSAVLRTLTVPTGVQVTAIMNVINDATTSAGNFNTLLTSPNESDQAPSSSAAPLVTLRGGSQVVSEGRVMVRTNTSAQIRSRNGTSSGAADKLLISTVGWIDLRGKNQ